MSFSLSFAVKTPFKSRSIVRQVFSPVKAETIGHVDNLISLPVIQIADQHALASPCTVEQQWAAAV